MPPDTYFRDRRDLWLDDAKEVPDTQIVTYGTEGTLVLTNSHWQVYRSNGELGPRKAVSGGSHEGSFLECLKTRKQPNSHVEIGRLSTTLCHLGNISYKLKRDIHFDPKTETFGSDKAANALSMKEDRAPYSLPKA